MEADINKMENRKIIENVSKTKSWFSEKVNKMDKLLAIIQGWGTLFLPMAVWVFITSFEATQYYQLKN